MKTDEIIEMANQAGIVNPQMVINTLEDFAKLVAQHEREKLEGQIQTLHAMYELASKQRDQLMEEQRAQIAAMRGRVQ